MRYPNVREEELKNKVAKDFFHAFDCTRIVDNKTKRYQKRGQILRVLGLFFVPNF